MASSLPDRLDRLPRKSLAMGLRPAESEQAKPDPKALAVEWKRRVGRVIERALVLADMSKQDASHEMGYPPGDQSAISKWISGVEPPQMHKLIAVDQLRPWIPVAFAIEFGADVTATIAVPMRKSEVA